MTLSKKSFFYSPLLILISVFLFSCSDGSDDVVPVVIAEEEHMGRSVLELNLRVHIMTDIEMIHRQQGNE